MFPHLLGMSFLIIAVQGGHVPFKVFLELFKCPDSLVECSKKIKQDALSL
jgi:hypothetical protein